MIWVVVASGVTIAFSIAFWQQLVSWANQTLAEWLGKLFGEDLREAFLLILAGVDRLATSFTRAATAIRERLVSARVLFRQLFGGREHERVVKAEFRTATGELVTREAAESVPWHELPDEVREKFIRRQTAEVELELKLKS
jgi:hypothetical protein